MKRVALFVGINTYPDSPLSCARADAESLYREFCGMYDKTSLLVDESATPDNVVQEIVKCRDALSPGDMFLFYFSGHGCAQDGDRMLAIPEYDVQGNDLGLSGLALSTLKEMTDIKGLHRLFVLDCCRNVVGRVNNPRARGKMAGYLYRHGRRSLIQPTILSSSAPGQSSYEHPGSGHGYFTEAFLAAIRNPGVRSFNMFRDRLDFEMQSLRTPAAQDPYFEGGIGSNLPFWPRWDCVAEVVHAAPSAGSAQMVTLGDVVKAFKSLSHSAFYVGTAIPPEKRRNAWNAMRVNGQDSSLLAVFDNTFWGGSRKGFVLTPEGVYARNSDAEQPFFCPWAKIRRVDCKDQYIAINDHLVDTLYFDNENRGKCIRAIGMLAKKIRCAEQCSAAVASEVAPVEHGESHASADGLGHGAEGCLFVVKDWYCIAGRGFVADGTVKGDKVDVGMRVEVLRQGALFCNARVRGIVKKGKRVEHVKAGDDVGLLLQSGKLRKLSDLEPGMVLKIPTSAIYAHEVEEKPELVTNGRKIPCRKKKSDHPHVLMTTDGLIPEPGYDWNSNSARDLSVKWSPGADHPDIPHVVASSSEGRWIPESGYVWDGPRSVKKE